MNARAEPRSGSKRCGLSTARSLASGNPDLAPEIGKTYSIGMVLQPTFLPGFNASIDFYKVDISGAIGSLSIQQIVNLCAAGNQAGCALITPTPGGSRQYDIVNKPLNLASESTKGLDFETSYRFQLADLFSGMDGAMSIRGLATNYMDYTVNSGLPASVIVQRVGQTNSSGMPDWRYNLSINYMDGPLSLTGTMRGVTPSVIDNNYIECQSGCPASTTDHPTYDNIQVDGATYFDLAASYMFGGEGQYEAYFNVRNLFNKDPAIVPPGPTGHATWLYSPANSAQFDVLGRTFRAGFRFKM